MAGQGALHPDAQALIRDEGAAHGAELKGIAVDQLDGTAFGRGHGAHGAVDDRAQDGIEVVAEGCQCGLSVA